MEGSLAGGLVGGGYAAHTLQAAALELLRQIVYSFVHLDIYGTEIISEAIITKIQYKK